MSGWIRNLLVLSTVVLGVGLSSAFAQETTAPSKPDRGVIATFWTMPKEDGNVTLLVSGESKPTTLAIDSNLPMSGVCHDCNMMLHFKAKDAGKSCDMCSCSLSNAECIVWTKLKTNAWQGLLPGLPRGTGLHLVYQVADKPDSGLKKLDIDRKVVLLPVTGLAGVTVPQILAMVKPFGGTRVEFVAENTQVLIHLSSEWTTENEAKFEKALTTVGCKIDWNTADTAVASK
jgi:hypothetical protein